MARKLPLLARDDFKEMAEISKTFVSHTATSTCLLSLCVDVSLYQFIRRLTERMAQSHVPQSEFQNVVFELVYTTSQLDFYIHRLC